MKCVRLFLTAICALGMCTPLPAAEFCVTNSTELQNALTAAASNGEADTIRIAAGNYNAPLGGFAYPGQQQGGDDHHLTLIGGWTEFFQNPCGVILGNNPFQTVLDGNNSSRVMNLELRENSNLTVRLLTFVNGNASAPNEGGGGLRVLPNTGGDYAGQIRIESNAFMNNTATNTGGLQVGFNASGNAGLWITGNLFVINNGGLVGAAEMVVNGNDGGLFVVNNTAINNTSASETLPGGLWVAGSVPTRVVVNNNLWGNNNADLSLVTVGNLALFNNNIGHRTGVSPTSESGNISVAPQYEPCLFCFEWVPVLNSPLVDAGMHPRFNSDWSLPDFDLRGMPRVNGGTVDIGAYENHDRLFYDRFED